MVLEFRSPSHHNASLGKKIPHPASTNFCDEILPPAKRLKVFESTDGEDSQDVSGDEDVLRTPISYRDEVPDSEDDDCSEDDERFPVQHPTELESALAPVKTDKEAIQQYEAMRAAENGLGDVDSRLANRSWTKGKSSIYVDAFNLALDTVLDDEGHLFDEQEMEVFKQWRDLEYESQYL